MILVVCEDTDFSATWATEGLRMRGLSPTVLRGRDLMLIRSWCHTLGKDGTKLALKSEDREIHSEDIHGVFNRLSYVPRAWVERYGGPDRDYALQEMMAFYLSWLNALPGPLLNPPTPQGLCGNLRHPSAWTALGVKAGLPVVPYHQSHLDDPNAVWQKMQNPQAQSVFVIAGQLVGGHMLASSQQAACLKMALLAGSPLLGIDFIRSNTGQWLMVSASPQPELTRGGEPLLDAIAKVYLS